MGLSSISHPRGNLSHSEALGQIGIFREDNKQQGEQVMETLRIIENEEEYKVWLQQSQKILDDELAKAVILHPQSHKFSKTGFCGGATQVQIVFDNHSYTMKQQIQKRRKESSHLIYFLQVEMWYILYIFVQAGYIFQLRKRNKIGNFHPKKIVINEMGHIKVVTLLSLPDQVTNFHKFANQNKTLDTYLAPEEFKKTDINRQIYPIEVDPCRADVFSIGMTLLNIGTLQDCSDVYDKEKWKINQLLIDRRLSGLGARYGGLLTHTVASMLEINPNKRKKCSQIYNMLQPYETQISDMKPFGIRQKRIQDSEGTLINHHYSLSVGGINNTKPFSSTVQMAQRSSAIRGIA